MSGVDNVLEISFDVDVYMNIFDVPTDIFDIPNLLDTTLIIKIISICPVNETIILNEGVKIPGSSRNSTEVVLLWISHKLGNDYSTIRNTTCEESNIGELGEHLHEGKQLTLLSARSLSWDVPLTFLTSRKKLSRVL